MLFTLVLFLNRTDFLLKTAFDFKQARMGFGGQ